MRKHFLLIPLISVSLASGCTTMVDESDRAAIDVKETAKAASERIKGYFTYQPKTSPQIPPVAERYCYKVLLDIVCYAEPYSPLADRLSGVQTPDSGERYIAQEALVSRQAENTDNVEQAEVRPVFVNAAPGVQEVKRVIRPDEQSPNSQLY